MAGSFLVNGEADDGVAANDRGLAYGDGLFETIALRRGRPLLWQEHLDRLSLGATRLGLPSPDGALWQADLTSLFASSPAERQVLKLVLTRGAGGRGYAPPAEATPTRVVQLFEWPTWPEAHFQEGIVAHLCATRLGCNPALAGIKHLNRLEQVLAAREVALAGHAEGLMQDSDGRLVEGVRSNLFLVVDHELITPALHRCGIRGVMREALIAIARDLQIPCREMDCDLSLLKRATELFVCNSLIGLWPVRAVAGLSTPSLGLGPVTRRLQSLLQTRDLVA